MFIKQTELGKNTHSPFGIWSEGVSKLWFLGKKTQPISIKLI